MSLFRAKTTDEAAIEAADIHTAERFGLATGIHLGTERKRPPGLPCDARRPHLQSASRTPIEGSRAVGSTNPEKRARSSTSQERRAQTHATEGPAAPLQVRADQR